MSMSEQDTKSQILKSATYLLRKRSYNSFSYNDISKELGITKATIHYHFPTKDVLGVEAVDNYLGKLKYLTQKADQVDDIWERLDLYFGFFKHGLDKDNLLCPGGILSVEYNTLNKEMQDGLRGLFRFYQDWIAKLLEEGRQQGEFVFEGSVEDMAIFIASTIEGGLIFARAYQPDYYQNVVDRLKGMLRP